MYDEFLFKAVKYFGSQKNLASALCVSQQAVNHWLNRSKKVPYLQALKIDIYTEGKIRIEDLNDEEKELTFLLKQKFSQKVPVVYLPLEKIVIGDKQCPIYPDFQTPHLVTVLPNQMLPILVSDDNQLIACECRLRIYRSIDCKVKVYRLNAKNMLKTSANVENLLKDFPISERVAVGMFVEQELGNRRGRRTDLELPDNYPEVTAGNETREIAARLAGFGSEYSYRQVKELLKYAIPELIKAMDDRLITVSKASQIADLPEAEQYLFMAMRKQKNQ